MIGAGRRVQIKLVAALVLASSLAAAAPDDAGTAGIEPVDNAALARLAAPPLGLPPVPQPAANPATAAKIALGRKLFFDRRLSRNGTMSCGMCHVPEQGFTNNELATPIGVEGRSLRRNAPTILNVAYQKSLFHDGRETTLETQALAPLIAPDEMANPSLGWLLDKIAALPVYTRLFQEAFGAGPSADRLGQALAAWERTLLAGNSPFDRWHYGGEADALTPRQKRGYALFVGAAGCAQCHEVGAQSALFTDHAFHDTGVGRRRAERLRNDRGAVEVPLAPGVKTAMSRDVLATIGAPPRPDAGRLEVTDRPEDLWRFKTPSLRNVALTAPYMHDGSLPSLTAVVDYYADDAHRYAAPETGLARLDLDADDRVALVAFLRALTGGNIDALIADARSVSVGN